MVNRNRKTQAEAVYEKYDQGGQGMNLLKGDGTAPENGYATKLTSWPERKPDGLGLSVKDGWFFGVGFGLAVAIIMILSSCIIWFGFILVLGSSLGALFSGS